MFTINDFDELDFFKFGRAALYKNQLTYLEHAMFDLHSPMEKVINNYNLINKESKPTFIRPNFKRACNLLNEAQKQFINNKLQKFLHHLYQTEGNDFFNAFVVVSPNSVLKHIHTGICFEQTYVFTIPFENSATEFYVGDDDEKAFDVPLTDYFMRLQGDPIPHHVISYDNNLKFYFVFEYNRPPKTNYPFHQALEMDKIINIKN